MKSILLIGLGRFGKNIAIHLNKLGHQVMAVDDEEERVENVLPYVTNAQIGDSTNKDFLESLGFLGFLGICLFLPEGPGCQRLTLQHLCAIFGARSALRSHLQEARFSGIIH